MKTFQNKTVYNRTQHDSDNTYLKISSKLINDTRLNVIEIGLMVKILSNSDNYILNSTVLQKESGIGEDKFYKSIKNLITFGYIIKKRNQSGVNWIINETSITLENTSNENVKNTENTSNETIDVEKIHSQVPNSINCVSTSIENTSCENTGITITNETIIKEISIKEIGPFTGPDKIEITREISSKEIFEKSVDISFSEKINDIDSSTEEFLNVPEVEENNSNPTNAVKDLPVDEEEEELSFSSIKIEQYTGPEEKIFDAFNNIDEILNSNPTSSATSDLQLENFNTRIYLKEFFDRIKDRTSTLPVDKRVPMVFNDILNKIDDIDNMNIFVNELSLSPELTPENRERIAILLQ